MQMSLGQRPQIAAAGCRSVAVGGHGHNCNAVNLPVDPKIRVLPEFCHINTENNKMLVFPLANIFYHGVLRPSYPASIVASPG